MMKEKEWISLYLPKDLAKSLKETKDEDELIEKEILRYVESVKKDIGNTVENLEEDVLMFKAKIASYKKAFKEAYLSADEEMYSFWEKLDKKQSEKIKRIEERADRVFKMIDSGIEKRSESIKRLLDRLESINIYTFEKMLLFLKQYNDLDESTKNLFLTMLEVRQ